MTDNRFVGNHERSHVFYAQSPRERPRHTPKTALHQPVSKRKTPRQVGELPRGLNPKRGLSGRSSERLGRFRQQRIHEALEAVEVVNAELQERDGQAIWIHPPHDP